MRNVLQLFNLRDNPVFHRYRRSQLRFKRSIFWYLATLIITTFVVSLNYIIETNLGFSEQYSARSQWIPLLVIQGLIVLVKGTGKTSAGLIQDKIDQTLDYQRLTPVSPLRNVIGYLFGLPILEYVMFALTLPHLAFIVIKGNIPLSAVFTVYLVFFICAIFYHMTAVAIGMVMKHWLFGSLLSIVSVAFLNVILVPLGALFGLKFLQYLSVFPVIGQEVQPLIVPQSPDDLPASRLQNFVPQPPPQGGGPAQGLGGGPPQGFGGPAPGFGGPPQGLGGSGGPPFQGGRPRGAEEDFFSFADPVPFFEWTLSPFVFTLLLQTGLIVTMTTMAVRRWQKEDKHSLSKPYALGILAVFLLLLIGNLWPVITRDFLPFPILGESTLDALAEPIALLLPLIYTVLILLLSIFLFSNVVPTHSAYTRGVRRAKKHHMAAARPWDDDAANIPFMCLFIVFALVGYWVIWQQMSDADYMRFLDGTRFAAWRLPLAFGLILLNAYLLIQVLERRGTMLTALLLWTLPILVGIVSAAAMERLSSFHTVVASLSPLATLLMTSALPIEAAVGPAPGEEFDALYTGSTMGLVFVSLQTALLALRWRQLRLSLR